MDLTVDEFAAALDGAFAGLAAAGSWSCIVADGSRQVYTVPAVLPKRVMTAIDGPTFAIKKRMELPPTCSREDMRQSMPVLTWNVATHVLESGSPVYRVVAVTTSRDRVDTDGWVDLSVHVDVVRAASAADADDKKAPL